MALINGLPPDSALHRAQMNGQSWTWTEALLWRLGYFLEVIVKLLIWQKDGKKPKFPKWRDYPWAKAEGSTHYGDRGDLTNEDIERWVDSLHPHRSTK